MKLNNGAQTPLVKSNYIVVVHMTSGTAKLSIVVDDLPAVDLPDTNWATSTAVQVQLPNCQLIATTTGDAQVSILDTKTALTK